MVSLKDRITNVNTVYYYSVDVDELQSAIAELQEVLDNPILSANNRNGAESLLMRLVTKTYAVAYFRKFRDSVYVKLEQFVAENLPIAAERNYTLSARVMTETKALLLTVKRYVDIRDEMTVLSKSETLLTESNLISKADEIIGEIKAAPLVNPFGEEIRFIDIAARLTEYFGQWKDEIMDSYGIALEHSVKVRALDYYKYDYYPVPDYEEGGRAKAVIIDTPFADEARLYAAHLAPDGEKVYEFDANEFGTSESGIARVFNYLNYKKCGTLITNAEMLGEDNLKALLSAVMYAGKNGVTVFVVDTEGGRLYDSALCAAAADENLSALDVSNEYVTMPSFYDVVAEIKSLRLCDSEDEIRAKLQEMPFIGFMGLNEITRPEYRSSWYTHGKKLSAGKAASAKKYLNKLKSAMLFIDDGWGEFSPGVTAIDEVGEFNYDDLKDLDIANVRRIVESNATVFGKCGMAVRYCTTGTGDMTDWDRLSREEMSERVTLATRLVFGILRVPITPVVEVLDELENDTAGGLCCDGGKLIQYKYKECKDIAWMRDAIVHESFHALQAKLTGGNWSPWYYDNMGITFGRVQRWKDTRQIYNSNTKSDVYKVHMYEADARAFEIDCRRGLDYYWNTIDLN